MSKYKVKLELIKHYEMEVTADTKQKAIDEAWTMLLRDGMYEITHHKETFYRDEAEEMK